jgi:hypothetical protein
MCEIGRVLSEPPHQMVWLNSEAGMDRLEHNHRKRLPRRLSLKQSPTRWNKCPHKKLTVPINDRYSSPFRIQL